MAAGVAPLAESHLRVERRVPARWPNWRGGNPRRGRGGWQAIPSPLGKYPPSTPSRNRLQARQGANRGVPEAPLGRYPQRATLDLHRIDGKGSREAVWRFVHEASEPGSAASIITAGRGDEASRSLGRLKSYVAHWLPTLSAVLYSAFDHHGGYGALLC